MVYCVYGLYMTHTHAHCIVALLPRPCKASDNWTCITFNPDLAKFDMELLEPDTVALMAKRVYDTAGVLGKGCKARSRAK